MRLSPILLILASTTAAAAADEKFPQTIPAPHGEIYLNNAFERDVLYGDWHFAPARRVGDFVFLSGVVAGPRQGEGKSVEAFKGQVRRAFAALQGSLTAAKVTFADVVELQTFHVFASAHFDGAKQAHLDAFRAVKDEFMKPPYPTWTAIGVEALVPDSGLVEIKLTAYAPAKRADRARRETKFAGLTR
jgi:enamine deaminase RidA (YjgF/YER057c/UK114 family)